jgi:hypothetical protein
LLGVHCGYGDREGGIVRGRRGSAVDRQPRAEVSAFVWVPSRLLILGIRRYSTRLGDAEASQVNELVDRFEEKRDLFTRTGVAMPPRPDPKNVPVVWQYFRESAADFRRVLEDRKVSLTVLDVGDELSDGGGGLQIRKNILERLASRLDLLGDLVEWRERLVRHASLLLAVGMLLLVGGFVLTVA